MSKMLSSSEAILTATARLKEFVQQQVKTTTINVMDNDIAECKIDGSTDDYASLKAIVDYVNSIKVPVVLYFPYTGKPMMISNCIEISRGDITVEIYCDITFTKSVFSAEESMTLFMFNKHKWSRKPIHNVNVIGNGITIDGNGSAITYEETVTTKENNGECMQFKRVDGGTIKGITFKNGFNDGLKLVHCRNILVDNCEFCYTCFDNGLTVMGMPVYTGGDFDGEADKPWVYDDYDEMCKNYITINNCRAHHNKDVGIAVAVCRYVTVSNCVTYENGNADGFNSGGGFSHESLSITKYYENDMTWDNHVLFDNCTASNNNNYGFYTDSKGTTYRGCIVDKTVQTDSSTYGRTKRGGAGFYISAKGTVNIEDVSVKNTDSYALLIFRASSDEESNVKIDESTLENCSKGIYVYNVDDFYIKNTNMRNIDGGTFFMADGNAKSKVFIDTVNVHNSAACNLGNSKYFQMRNCFFESKQGLNIALEFYKIANGIVKDNYVSKGVNTAYLTAFYISDNNESGLVIDTTYNTSNANKIINDARTTATE